MQVYLYNTLSRKKELFKPIHSNSIGLYTCGPTVYHYQHLGNYRTYIFEDLLKRVLRFNGYFIKHVMNITDVGHLTSDADEGEDKVEQQAAKEGKDAWELATFYTKNFEENLNRLNISPPDIWCKATDHIPEQIALVQALERKGYTYIIPEDGVYFDTSRLEDYGKLARLDIKGLQEGKRIKTEGKKNPTDFALWKFSPKKSKRQMEWDSPWGIGFPGWHIECSAMSMKYLGQHFDIHCGGIDHIPVHHTNEIAQNEGVTGTISVNYWMHGAFLNLKERKMSKSKGDFLRPETLQEEGFEPLDYRYFCLTAQYSKPLEYSTEALIGAKNSYQKLKEKTLEIKEGKKPGEPATKYLEAFQEAVNDDLNMPRALAVLWEMINDSAVADTNKYKAIIEMDHILGLGLDTLIITIPASIQALAEEREQARQTKNWKQSDILRQQIEAAGYTIQDKPKGYALKPKHL
ncbi:MAG: cysteine--tRNA ligase [Nanoarchaeota archaeon]|nr:cysteine--tRNA ligase [Nanoarchaeota archaeon]